MTSGTKAGQKMLRVGKQMAREFWFPLVVAVCWTLFRYVSTGGGILTVIADFAAAFFLASWATGQVVRVNRQQTVEDRLQTLVQSSNNLMTGVSTILKAAEQLQNQTKDVPGLNETAQKLLASMQTASTQVSQANTAISAAANELPPMGWISDWPIPHRARPNPAIYGTGANTPLPLREAAKDKTADG